MPITIERPAAGEINRAAVIAEENIRLTFDIAQIAAQRVGSDLELNFEDGGAVLLEDFFTAMPETLILEDGTLMPAEDFLESAEGLAPAPHDPTPHGIPSGGLNAYRYTPGKLLYMDEVMERLSSDDRQIPQPREDDPLAGPRPGELVADAAVSGLLWQSDSERNIEETFINGMNFLGNNELPDIPANGQYVDLDGLEAARRSMVDEQGDGDDAGTTLYSILLDNWANSITRFPVENLEQPQPGGHLRDSNPFHGLGGLGAESIPDAVLIDLTLDYPQSLDELLANVQSLASMQDALASGGALIITGNDAGEGISAPGAVKHNDAPFQIQGLEGEFNHYSYTIHDSGLVQLFVEAGLPFIIT